VGVAVAIAAGTVVATDDIRDIAEGDVAVAAHYILNFHVERSQELLPLFRNARLNVSGCKQTIGTLSGARPILISRFAVGARGILVDQVVTNKGHAATVFGLCT